ncbi:MAG: type 1 glutamine amidotransferase domain-containing protein [Chloroflexota bacterium]|jgi:protease I
MPLTGKRIAILAEANYDDLELWYPLLRLREEGADTFVVGTGKESYPSKHGYVVKADAEAETVSANQFDAIIIPGGYAPDRLRRYSSVLKLIKDANEQGKIIGAICHAAWVLISAQIVRGRAITCVKAIKDDVVNAGANYLDKEVVRDGNLITSRTPDDLPAFGAALVSALKEV